MLQKPECFQRGKKRKNDERISMSGKISVIINGMPEHSKWSNQKKVGVRKWIL
jgi:hypothetical protein